MSAGTRAFPITIEQYEGFEGYPGLRDELINGRIVMSPEAKPLHQLVAKKIERAFDDLTEGSAYVANQDTNFKFPALNSMPAPDVFIVRRDEWLEACRQEAYMSTPPLVAVEILSPANRRSRVAEKVGIYLTAGVLSVWVVDLKRQMVRVHSTGTEIVYGSSDSIPLPVPLTGSVALEGIFKLE